jgi:hypothetical protein
MGQAGRRRFERLFTAALMVHETLRVYEELAGSQPAIRSAYAFPEDTADAA